jgi:hypothetical protein
MELQTVEHEHAICSGWLEREDPEWEHAWSHFPDPVMAHPESGECLQYLGSAQYPERGWVHVFRHHQVPGTDQRQSWHVPAAAGWLPAQQRPPAAAPGRHSHARGVVKGTCSRFID